MGIILIAYLGAEHKTSAQACLQCWGMNLPPPQQKLLHEFEWPKEVSACTAAEQCIHLE